MNNFIPNITLNSRKKFQRNLSCIRGVNSKARNLAFGNFGLRIMDGFFMMDFHFKTITELSKRILKSYSKGKNYNIVWRFFPNRSETKKTSSRMGGGKGDIENWSVGIKKESIIVEYVNIFSYEAAVELFRQASAKLPVPLHLVFKDEVGLVKEVVTWRKK